MSDSNFQKKVIKDFILIIEKHRNFVKTGVYQYSQYSIDPIVDYIFGLEKRNFIALISSSHWNNYPSWSSKYFGKKPHGDVLARVMREIVFSSNIIRSLFAKKSVGLWHRISLDYLTGLDRVLCAKRGIKSLDRRVRLKSVEIVPTSILIKNMKNLLSDKHKPISWKLITRLGPDNYADITKEYTTCNWTRRDAIRRNIAGSSVSLDLLLKEMNKLLVMEDETPFNSKKYDQRDLINALVKNLKTSDALFMLSDSLNNDWHDIQNNIKKKIRVREWARD